MSFLSSKPASNNNVLQLSRVVIYFKTHEKPPIQPCYGRSCYILSVAAPEVSSGKGVFVPLLGVRLCCLNGSPAMLTKWIREGRSRPGKRVGYWLKYCQQYRTFPSFNSSPSSCYGFCPVSSPFCPSPTLPHAVTLASEDIARLLPHPSGCGPAMQNGPASFAVNGAT